MDSKPGVKEGHMLEGHPKVSLGTTFSHSYHGPLTAHHGVTEDTETTRRTATDVWFLPGRFRPVKHRQQVTTTADFFLRAASVSSVSPWCAVNGPA